MVRLLEAQTLSTPTAEQHRIIVRRFVDELWNGVDLTVADEIFAPDCVPHSLQYSPHTLGSRRGPKHIKLIVTAWRAAFPDWRMTINHLCTEDDKVVLVSTGYGTQRGELLGTAPTGRRVEFTGVRVFRFVDYKIAEYWVLWDWQGLWQQLGALPSD